VDAISAINGANPPSRVASTVLSRTRDESHDKRSGSGQYPRSSDWLWWICLERLSDARNGAVAMIGVETKLVVMKGGRLRDVKQKDPEGKL